MPSYAQESQRYHTDRVRAALFFMPNAGRKTVQRILEQDPNHPLHLQDKYIDKLLRKIHKERANRQSKTILHEIAVMEDELEWFREETVRILFSVVGAGEKLRAIGLTWKMRLDLFQAKLDAGIFERQAGTVKVEGSFPPEYAALLDKALDNVLNKGRALANTQD